MKEEKTKIIKKLSNYCKAYFHGMDKTEELYSKNQEPYQRSSKD
jgi:hypothetical protein